MKRRIFFWLERLKITPAERKTIAGLMILLGLLGGVNLALSPSIPFEDGHYLELEKQFEKRTVMIKAREKKLMEQYFPTETKQIYAVKSDTMPEDTLAEEEPKKSSQQSQNEQIDINSANYKALQSLPGIGPTYARRIIDYRNDNDGFASIEELKKIKGIAQKRLEKLKPFVKLKDSK
jgi:comEA protein